MPVSSRCAKREQPVSSYFFCRSRMYPTTAFTWSGVRALDTEACFGLVVTTFVRSVSDIFLASSETRLLAAPLPAPSGPWHIAHLALKRDAPSSAAHDR